MPRLSPDSAEFTVNSFTEDDQTTPSIAALPGGGYVIVWTSDDVDGDNDGIAGRIFDADGAPVGDEFVINTEIEGNQLHPSVSALENGGFIVTWYSFDNDVDGDSTGIAARVFDATGTAVTGEFTVNAETTGSQYASSVATLPGGGFVITWQSADADVDGSGYGISARVYDDSGTAITGEFTVNSEIDGSQYHPSVAALENGGFVVTWYSYDPTLEGGADETLDGTAIAARVFDASGNPVSDEFSVATNTEDNQLMPSVTGLSGGGFVITWYSEAEAVDGDDTGIAAQIYDASGAPVDSEFTVNSNTEGGQYNPVVTALADGGFVISWSSNDPASDGNQGAVSGQIFTADGTPVSGEFTVNSETEFNQLYPTISGLENGGFVVAWASEDPDVDGNGYGIAARSFSENVQEGSSSADSFYGDAYDNIFVGNGGADQLYGAGGEDSLTGGADNDTLGGGAANDTLEGDEGNDTIFAGAGNDLVDGGADADELYGGAGDDAVTGGTGNDTLYSGSGDDTLTGGDGADRFAFAAGQGDDVITDFDTSADTLVIANTATDFSSFADVQAAATADTNGVLIDLGGGNSLLLEGLSLDDLTSIDFVF